jgi:hypothetical protein
MAEPLTSTEGLAVQAGAAALKAAPQEAAAQLPPVKAIAEAAAVLVRDQAQVAARGQAAGAAVYMVALVARVVHLPLPAQQLPEAAGAAVAPTVQAARVVVV